MNKARHAPPQKGKLTPGALRLLHRLNDQQVALVVACAVYMTSWSGKRDRRPSENKRLIERLLTPAQARARRRARKKAVAR